MADPKPPRRDPATPFSRLSAALGGRPAGDASEGGQDTFVIDREPAIIEVSLAHGASPCLVLRAHEEEPAPSSGYKKNVMARVRARLVYPAVTIRRVTSLERVNALFGLRFEIATGDPSFDREVTVDTDVSNDVLAQVFSTKEARTAVQEILAAGFTLHLEERAIRAELGFPTESHFGAAAISPLADALATLVSRVPRVDPATFTKRPQIGRFITGAIVVTGLVAALALAPGTLDDSGVPVRPLPRPIVPMPTMVPGLLIGSLAFVVSYLLLRWQIKRRGTNTDLPLVLALFVVMASLGVGVLDASNRLLDDAPLSVHDVKITGKDTGKSRKSGNVIEWLVAVPSWQPGPAQLELSIDAGLHSALRVGDTLRVTVHPGFFGWEWGAVVERAPGAPRGPEPLGEPDANGRPRRAPRDQPPGQPPPGDARPTDLEDP